MNRLADESSPYLRQHADNPVDWYPWGPEAFARATAEDKPILLSVGYSACHWCHVMAHESFEDADVAATMNDHFVCIKVDREERPDVDAIYMEAVQAMSGSGGWPMTVFLTPDRRPFFGGTYFPKTSAHGRPGFKDLCLAVDEAWTNQRADLETQAGDLTRAIAERTAVAAPDADAVIATEVLDQAYESLVSIHDATWGGFGRAPKFPLTSNIELLLRAYTRNHDAHTLEMITTTLDAMASGGIYDHLGGGFSRYSTDQQWLVPHFEKMLYDNALIPRVYLHAWQLTNEARFLQVVDETIAYVLRDLRDNDGGVCSAEDADSEGVEGKFYVWSVDDVAAAGGDAAVAWYGATPAGNFEGANILHRPVRGDLIRPPEIEAARQRLFEQRATRVRPGLDDKVLTEWNAMFIATLAEAAGATGRADWLESAGNIADALISRSRSAVGGRWLRSWQQHSGARHLAYAVDYAHLIDAFTRLAEATGRARWIDEATATADAMLDLFWDGADGGLFTTGADAEALLLRTKDTYDGATPSANSVAALALLRLGALTGVARYGDAAAAILRLLAVYLTKAPTAVTVAVAAVDFTLSGATEIVIAGDRDDLVRVALGGYRPNAVVTWGERYESPLWEGRTDGAAYVCRDFVCQLPARSAGELAAQLEPSST